MKNTPGLATNPRVTRADTADRGISSCDAVFAFYDAITMREPSTVLHVPVTGITCANNRHGKLGLCNKRAGTYSELASHTYRYRKSTGSSVGNWGRAMFRNVSPVDNWPANWDRQSLGQSNGFYGITPGTFLNLHVYHVLESGLMNVSCYHLLQSRWRRSSGG